MMTLTLPVATEHVRNLDASTVKCNVLPELTTATLKLMSSEMVTGSRLVK